MQGDIDLLFETIRNDQEFNYSGRFLYVNAQFHSDLLNYSSEQVKCVQYFKPYAQIIEKHGYNVVHNIDDEGVFDCAALLFPKNVIEGRYLIAKALSALKTGGVLMVSAGNKAGGGRLAKILKDFGLDQIEVYSGHKAKCVVAGVCAYDQGIVAGVLQEGRIQEILDGQFISQPGIYGWDKIDRGSELLCTHISDELNGRVADFGCGYGYLSHSILSRFGNISQLRCIDADWRSVRVCEQNLESFACDIRYLWEDLTKPVSKVSDLDFIVMNPPFHEGKSQDISIGKGFIETAYQSLRGGGVLWMVANVHLPYEELLNSNFSKVENVFEGQGFKVFRAMK